MADDRDARRAAAKQKSEELAAERRATVVLPRSGEPGPAALRTPGRLRLPRHQDTSATLAGAHPFLAEGGLGSDGVFVGQDLYSGSSFVYDPWVLYERGLITAPDVVLAGIVGSGKSSLAKSLYTRSIPFGRRVYVPGDPKGEHTAVAEAVGGKAIALGHGMAHRLNPLDEGHRPSGLDEIQWAGLVSTRRRDLIGALAETVLDRRLTPLEHTTVDVALNGAVRAAEVPVLPQVVERLLTPEQADDPDGRLADDGRMVGLRVASIGGRRPGRALRWSEHRPVRSDPADDLARPVTGDRERDAGFGADDVRIGVDGVGTPAPGRRTTMGRVRRGLAADVPPGVAAAHGCSLAARVTTGSRAC